jgi:thioredoxin reductase (NADPH)
MQDVADWDVIVVGGGPAGLSAAAAVAGAGRRCLLIDRMGGGGELMNLGTLVDLAEAPAGPDLAARLLEDAVAAGAELVIGEVTGLAPETGGWRVATAEGAYRARAVILAVGLAPGTLGLADEAAWEGRGLSHCAACDGPLYRGLPVVVAGGGRWALQEAQALSACGAAVTLVTEGEAAAAGPVIRGRIVGLEGAAGLEAVLVRPADGGVVRRIPAQAVFVQTGRRPAVGFAAGTLSLDQDGRLSANAARQTGLPAVFVAGDARAGAGRTLVCALADGRRAARSALTLFDTLA